jgi:hypothetical protein
MIRLVQLQSGAQRRIALVEEPNLRLLADFASIFALAEAAITQRLPLTELAVRHATGDSLNYDQVYRQNSPWRLLPSIDHPIEPTRCLVSGTGLTHLGSAKNRQAMHSAAVAEMTDSMRMFRGGVDGGRPAAGSIGTPPEWFYKGTGTILRAPGEPLTVPNFAGDGGEEAEIAGIYLIDPSGQPRRIGMTQGNEFSDHKFEKLNYLNLAGSKLRTCAIGPEVVVDPEFQAVAGTVTIERAGQAFWTKAIATGESEMCHSLANIEHHHFKFDAHRRPGDVHVHYYGAHSLSFGDGVQLVNGDVMSVHFAGFGRPLRNPLTVSDSPLVPVTVSALL